MATTTTIKATAGKYGNSNNDSFTNSGAHLYVGYNGNINFRSRLTFPALKTISAIGNKTIKISKVVLYMRRNDEGTTDITAGSSSSSSWSASRAATGSATWSAKTEWKSVNITSCANAIKGYSSNWYVHLRSSDTRIRLDGVGSNSNPYIKVTWEAVANTIKTETDETVLGTPVVFNITKGSSDASYTLTYKFGDESGTIASKTTSTRIEWVPPVSLASEIPKAEEGTATINMTVYNSSGSVLRTEVLYQSLVVPDNLLPVIPEDGIGIELVKTLGGYALTGETYANIIPKVDMNGTYGATVKSITATVTNGETVQNIPWTSVSEIDAGIFAGKALPTNIFKTAGTANVSIEVVDSRGRSVTAQGADISVQAYTRPIINYFAIDRYEPVYDANEEISGYVISDVGENVWVNIQASAAHVAPDGTELNSIAWEIVGNATQTRATGQYSGTGDGVNISITDDRTVIEDIVSAVSTMNYTLTVTDAVGNVVYAYDSVAPGISNFALAPSMGGASFGGIPKGTAESPLFECHYPAKFYSGIDGVTNYSTGTATLDKTYATVVDSSTAVKWYKYGRIVMVYCNMRLTKSKMTSTYTNYTIATGLPAPIAAIRGFTANPDYLTQGSWVDITTAGALRFVARNVNLSDVSGDKNLVVTFCYISKN